MLTVVAGILERAGAILICQRPPNKLHPLKWEFPGGKVEVGETPAAALQRELREELAIEAVIGPEITRYEFTYPERDPILLIFFRISDFGGEPGNLAFEQICWQQPQSLSSYDFVEGDRQFLRCWPDGAIESSDASIPADVSSKEATYVPGHQGTDRHDFPGGPRRPQRP